ncbi:putative permease YjgP/YjgQ family protein [Anatilimnocola aggregata]|uniref:Putative permease YjgP/YjgQ family protein n=1 Tax=Anatilimnocola aggregata TaxID=2528021 RepID=A0A517YKX6_9BACT|nr:LptF/LptG family permease [Anatilimnocola aggregata]QDU30882.1 putative permease YjgP/YjgQ family protein [Anatilimnocola aggregata]
MTLIDRYVLGLYLKALLMSFLVMAGMYMLVDVFANLEEHIANSADYRFKVPHLLADYYGPRLLWVFDKTAGILAASAAIFAVTWLQGTQELTAILSAGIRPTRVLRPIFFCTLIVAGLGVANREVWLPSFRSQLARNAQDWRGDKAKNCTPQFDPRSDVLLSGKKTIGKEKRIEGPMFRLLSPEFATWGRQITADSAWYLPVDQGRPAGYLLSGVKQPANLASLGTLLIAGEPILLSPRDTPWLKPDECFVVSVVTFEQFALGNGWRQNLSTKELVHGLKNRSLQSGADILVTMHGRFVKPLLDIVLVFLGLPLVLGRASRNIFVAGGVCLGLMATFFIVSLICQGLGNNFLLRPTVAAWMPLMIFGPIAFTVARPLWD